MPLEGNPSYLHEVERGFKNKNEAWERRRVEIEIEEVLLNLENSFSCMIFFLLQILGREQEAGLLEEVGIVLPSPVVVLVWLVIDSSK